MGYIQQSPALIADAYKMTISMWFRLKSTDSTGGGVGNFFNLISWGDNFVVTSFNPGGPDITPYFDQSLSSLISVCDNPDFGLRLNLMSRPHSNPYW